MNKKVLSALLFGALIAGTSTFTSCIDNEEPASIVTLRGAKAELLKAKAAVENAKVALVQAQAETERAQATLLQAQAAAVAAKAESDKALANAQLAEAQARAEQALAEAEAARLQAEAAYQKSIMELKTMQATLLQKQQMALMPIIKQYEEMLGLYNAAVDSQTKAERALAKHISVLEDLEANKALLTRELTRKVNATEKAYAGEVTALEEAQKAYTAAQALEPHEYAKLYADVQASLEKIRLEVIDLNVTAGETLIALNNDKCVADMSELVKETGKLATEEIYTLPAFEIDLAGGIYRKKLISYEEETVAYSDILYRCETLNAEIKALENAYRDENDNAWTKEFVVILKEELKAKQAELAEVKKAWEEAVAAYNTNEYKDADEKAISGYDDVVAALTAFNTAQAAVNTAAEAWVALHTEEADKKAYEEACAKNEATHNTAWQKAYDEWAAATDPEGDLWKNALAAKMKTHTDAVKTAEKNLADKQAEIGKLTTEAENAKSAYDNAVLAGKPQDKLDELDALRDKADLALETAKGEITGLQAKVDEAEAKVTTEQPKEEANLKAELDKAKQDTFDKIYAEWVKANADAEKVYSDKWNEETGTAVLAIAAQEEVVAEKEEAAAEANKELREAAETYNDNAGYRAIHVRSLRSLLRGEYDEEKGYAVRDTETPIEDILVLDKDAMMKVVIRLSSELYGKSFGAKRDMYHGYEARLVAITAEQIEAWIEEDYAEKSVFTAVDYIDECGKYGVMGEEMALAEKIRVAEFWLTNTKYIDDNIAALTEANEALEAIETEAKAAIDKKVEEFATLFEAHIQEMYDAVAPVEAKLAEVKPLQALNLVYLKALGELKAAGEENLTQKQIDDFVATCKQKVTDAELSVYNAETKMLWAREILAKWNQGAIEYKEILEAELEDANTAVERATKALNDANAQLEAAIEALQWSAAE